MDMASTAACRPNLRVSPLVSIAVMAASFV
jgi:hypothetical protein